MTHHPEYVATDLHRVSSFWLIVMLRGLVGIAFAAVAFYAAGAMGDRVGEVLGSVFIIASFAVYLVIANALSIWLAVSAFRSRHWPLTVVHAALLFAVAWWCLFAVGVTLKTIAFFAVAHALIAGIAEGALGYRLRRHTVRSELLTFAAVISWAVAVAIILNRGDARHMTLLLAFYAAFVGTLFVALAVELRRLQAHHRHHPLKRAA